MKKYLVLLFFASCGPVVAQVPQQFLNPSEPSKIYLKQADCPAPCYPIVKDGALIGDVDTLSVKDGDLVVDEAKKAQKEARLAQEKADKLTQDQARAERLKRIKDFDLQSANTIAKLKELLKEMQEELSAR